MTLSSYDEDGGKKAPESNVGIEDGDPLIVMMGNQHWQCWAAGCYHSDQTTFSVQGREKLFYLSEITFKLSVYIISYRTEV